MQLWMGTQVPALAAKAAADAIGMALDNVTVHPMMIGGSFGRKFEVEIAAQVAVLGSAQVAALSTAQVTSLGTDDLNSLTTAQFAAFETRDLRSRS